ncbi:uncharacterized protein LACBIDRAFT_333547, partial [Laccaria bicolor S238N-H82]
YCMEMNARPIQQAEKDFFSTPLQVSCFNLISLEVPIVAIVTKFDTFVQDVQQKLEESAEEEDEEVDDDDVEKLAEIQADMQFEQHYKGPLNDMKHPPKAVVTLSKELQSKERNIYDLSTFFATAQNADTEVKLTTSASGPFIKTWETYWTHPKSGSQVPATLVRLLEKHLDSSQHYIGDPRSDFFEVRDGSPNLLRFCKWEQRVADTTLIMEKIRVFDIKDELKTLEALIKWYTQRSDTVTYVPPFFPVFRTPFFERLRETEYLQFALASLLDAWTISPLWAPATWEGMKSVQVYLYGDAWFEE